MPIVVDASVVLAPILKEARPRALAGLDRAEWVVPALWWFEVRNGLVVNERRNRVTEIETTGFLQRLSNTDLTIDSSPDEGALMALCRKHRLTVYDAAYLELALREQLPLATLDTALAAAARREGVAVPGDDAP